MKRRQRLATPLVVSFWLTAVLIFFLNNVGSQGASPLYQKVPPLDDLTVKDREALELGRKILAVKTALQDPCENASMKAIKDLGNDSRYYVLARGVDSAASENDRKLSRHRQVPRIRPGKKASRSTNPLPEKNDSLSRP